LHGRLDPGSATRTNTKRQKLIEAGAARVVPYHEDDMVAEVMRITEGRGARVAFDPVGGSLLPRVLKVMPWQARSTCTVRSAATP
jgi:NADPH:quinone reductase-like Zn-dependent oxidoreductase